MIMYNVIKKGKNSIFSLLTITMLFFSFTYGQVTSEEDGDYAYGTDKETKKKNEDFGVDFHIRYSAESTHPSKIDPYTGKVTEYLNNGPRLVTDLTNSYVNIHFFKNLFTFQINLITPDYIADDNLVDAFKQGVFYRSYSFRNDPVYRAGIVVNPFTPHKLNPFLETDSSTPGSLVEEIPYSKRELQTTPNLGIYNFKLVDTKDFITKIGLGYAYQGIAEGNGREEYYYVFHTTNNNTSITNIFFEDYKLRADNHWFNPQFSVSLNNFLGGRFTVSSIDNAFLSKNIEYDYEHDLGVKNTLTNHNQDDMFSSYNYEVTADFSSSLLDLAFVYRSSYDDTHYTAQHLEPQDGGLFHTVNEHTNADSSFVSGDILDPFRAPSSDSFVAREGYPMSKNVEVSNVITVTSLEGKAKYKSKKLDIMGQVEFGLFQDNYRYSDSYRRYEDDLNANNDNRATSYDSNYSVETDGTRLRIVGGIDYKFTKNFNLFAQGEVHFYNWTDTETLRYQTYIYTDSSTNDESDFDFERVSDRQNTDAETHTSTYFTGRNGNKMLLDDDNRLFTYNRYGSLSRIQDEPLVRLGGIAKISKSVSINLSYLFFWQYLDAAATRDLETVAPPPSDNAKNSIENNDVLSIIRNEVWTDIVYTHKLFSLKIGGIFNYKDNDAESKVSLSPHLILRYGLNDNLYVQGKLQYDGDSVGLEDLSLVDVTLVGSF